MSGPAERFVPAYRRLAETGELDLRVNALFERAADCDLCPCECHADRRTGLGRCATPAVPVLASWGPHFGEEPPISGLRGSGTVFLANCNLRCVYCQNADVSQRPRAFIGRGTSLDELAGVMLELEQQGCHNINWVSPSHQVAQLVGALAIAARRGLAVPVVYNTNAYDRVDVLRLLDGVVDVYMPDLKYADAASGATLSRVPDYPEVARAAITEMFRQVGAAWELDDDGVLRRGLLVRLLILPRGAAGIEESVRWIAEALTAEVAVSLMSQYRPDHFAARPGRYPGVNRRITPSEYAAALMALARWNRSEHTMVQPYFRVREDDD